MNTLERIISPARKDYAIECDNGSFEIDGLRFAIFDYDNKYVKIPGCPATPNVLQWSGFSEKEIESTWIGFKKFAKKFADESAPIHIDTIPKSYHYCNGYVAIYCEDAIVVFKSDCKIKASDLFMMGFTGNVEIFVPLSEEHIAYYDTTNNTLICGW